jgi:hypothetical protein
MADPWRIAVHEWGMLSARGSWVCRAAVGRASSEPFAEAAWIPERSATCLREADLNVLSKFGNQGLEWRLEPEAFTRREVRREDDLLDILVG